MNILDIVKNYENCECGQVHECGVRDVEIGCGLVNNVGEILYKNKFPKKLLLVADKTTLQDSEGIEKSLEGFELTYKIYDTLRVATMDNVREIEAYIDGGIEAVLAVGTGSIHDPCRLACANKNKPLCLFATAPSMDGFASYSAPIVNGNFKITYPAKCPEVIIGDTKILAASPVELKSAGFGDMVSKYIAIIDWQVSHLISGESYCKKVCDLTRYAVDNVMKMADRVTKDDEESAKIIFEGLLLTGIAMSFTKTSRPGRGTEHIMAHYIECKELLENKIPNYHGEDVGVMTLIMLKFYKDLLNKSAVKAHREITDWADVYEVYGKLALDVKKLNTPDTITDHIDPKLLEEKWDEIKKIIAGVPSYEEVYNAMKIAGCKTSVAEIGKSEMFVREAFRYHPYMRRRLSLRRLTNMFD